MVKYVVKIERANCIACGACYSLDSTHFEAEESSGRSKVVGGKTDDGFSSGIFEDNEIETVQQAVDSCPMSIISVEEL